MKLPKRLSQPRPAKQRFRLSGLRWNAAWEAQAFPNPEDQRRADLMNILLRVLLGASALIYLVILASPGQAWMIFGVASALLLVNLISLYLLRTGRLHLAILLVITGLTLVMTLAAALSGGVISASFVGLTAVVMIAGLLTGGAGGLVLAGITTFLGLGLVVAQGNAFLPQTLIPTTPLGFWFSLSALFFTVAELVSQVDTGLHRALLQARQKEAAQLQATAEMEQMRASLRDQNAERAQELALRSSYLQAVLEISQSTAALLDQGQVMRTTAQLIKEQFHLYYVGVFLVDASGDWAVLQAGEGPGQAVQAMLDRGHRLRIGSGMIGWSIANAQPRVASEAGQDIVRQATSELPETRSEAAIPLRSRGRVIGAISVQSQRPNAFGEMEINAYQALADQVATTLDNARLYTESAQALEEARRFYGQANRRAWQDFLHSRQQIDLTYRYGRLAAQAESGPMDGQATLSQVARQQALSSGRPVQISDERNALLFLPIPVREIHVGVIGFSKEITPGRPAAWGEDEIDLLQSIVEQLGLALDSARLYQDTQRLAQREQVTGEVTSHIRQTLDIQTVLHTAVEEIQRVFGLPEVIISLGEANASETNELDEARDEWVLAEPDQPQPTASISRGRNRPEGSR